MKAFVSLGIVALTLLTGSSAHSATRQGGIGRFGVVEPNPIRWSFVTPTPRQWANPNPRGFGVRPNPRGYGGISPNPRVFRGVRPNPRSWRLEPSAIGRSRSGVSPKRSGVTSNAAGRWG
jgi:hypothetical protein